MFNLVARRIIGLSALRFVCRLVSLVMLATALPWLPASYANHDIVSTPPPHSTTHKLQALPRPARAAVTVSGLSSGGFFAHQFHVAYSKLVNGAGIIAGGPYGCVESIPNPWSAFWTLPLDRFSAAVIACTHYYGSRYFGLRTAAPKTKDSIELISAAWDRHVIDDPANLADDRVWLFHGKDDEIVPKYDIEVLKQVYRNFGLREPKLHADENKDGRAANHGMPVARFTGVSNFPVRDCDQHEPPFVIQCGYEAAELLLRHLYPDGFREASDDPHRDGTLVAFDQSEFLDAQNSGIVLHPVGYVYVPTRCAEEECRVHVAFHGCKQDVESIQDDFIRDAGYNRWAAGNDIVVLYPQVAASGANPNRCWDFWGYSGPNYANQNGPQMRAVKAMIDRLLGE
jgi:hypothetical protein